MKFYIVTIILLSALACRKDNYDEPGTQLSGRIVYKGEPIEVEYNQVNLELYQSGFGKTGPISVTIAQDGSYNALLFNGDYKLIIPNGQGPFKWKQTPTGSPDTTVLTLSGSQTFDVEVTPYYMVRNPQITAAGGTINGKFRLEKIITDASGKNIENVSLYINRTAFVSGADNVAVTTLDGAAITDMNNISLTVAVPTLTQNYAFARIGVKIAGIEDRVFSSVVKVGL